MQKGRAYEMFPKWMSKFIPLCVLQQAATRMTGRFFLNLFDDDDLNIRRYFLNTYHTLIEIGKLFFLIDFECQTVDNHISQ